MADFDNIEPEVGVKLQPKQYAIFITGQDGKLLVGITPDGETEFGENYHPDTAAKVFWNCVANLMPTMPRTVLSNAAQEVRELLPKDSDGHMTCQLVAAWMEQKAKTYQF